MGKKTNFYRDRWGSNGSSAEMDVENESVGGQVQKEIKCADMRGMNEILFPCKSLI